MKCTSDEPIYMWTRGLARSCCDVFPTHFGSLMTPPERGSPFDDTYFYLKEVNDKDVVYVAAADLPIFLNKVFVKLPMTASITIVSGQEDIGGGYELFHGGREFMKTNLWGPSEYQPSLTEFISDPRLKHWFMQNYDIKGCVHQYFGGYCSAIHDVLLLKKVTPIPIGLDFHTKSEKSSAEESISPCDQQKEVGV